MTCSSPPAPAPAPGAYKASGDYVAPGARAGGRREAEEGFVDPAPQAIKIDKGARRGVGVYVCQDKATKDIVDAGAYLVQPNKDGAVTTSLAYDSSKYTCIHKYNVVRFGREAGADGVVQSINVRPT